MVKGGIGETFNKNREVPYAWSCVQFRLDALGLYRRVKLWCFFLLLPGEVYNYCCVRRNKTV